MSNPYGIAFSLVLHLVDLVISRLRVASHQALRALGPAALRREILGQQVVALDKRPFPIGYPSRAPVVNHSIS